MRLEGSTGAVMGISYTGQLFDGQGAFIALSTVLEPVLKTSAFMHVDLSR
jgi:hypothetical protein